VRVTRASLGTLIGMRANAVAALAVVASMLGAAAALAVAKGSGWLDDGRATTVVVRESASAPAPVAVTRPLPSGFQPARIYRERASGVVTIYAYFTHAGGTNTAQGSGFVVSKDGLVVTSAHVITDAGIARTGVHRARDVYVEFADGDRVQAQVVGFDPFDDVGVVRVSPRVHTVTPVPLGDSARVVVGEPVAAIGSPFDNESSLTVGIVSATRRTIASLTSQFNLVDAIQTDAPINKGNSGGPLFNARGEVIGINAQIRSDGGQGFEGVGFAVPINSAKRSLRQLVESGRVAYAFVGISTDDLTPSLARRLGFGIRRGALIGQVEKGSAAERAGLRAGDEEIRLNGQIVRAGGDVIVGIDGAPVQRASDVIRIVAQNLLPGETARFEIVRSGRRLVVPVTLTARQP
jgi:S1-C subfamily serine protease